VTGDDRNQEHSKEQQGTQQQKTPNTKRQREKGKEQTPKGKEQTPKGKEQKVNK
jgi:hypothetical protein